MNSPSASLKKAASGCTRAARNPPAPDRRRNRTPDSRSRRCPARSPRCIPRANRPRTRPHREIGNAAGMARRAAAGKARHREIEAAPEEMHRACLAEKAGAELLEHAIDVDRNLKEAPHRRGVVGCMARILRKTDRVRQFVRHVVDFERQCRVRPARPSPPHKNSRPIARRAQTGAARRRWSKSARDDR